MPLALITAQLALLSAQIGPAWPHSPHSTPQLYFLRMNGYWVLLQNPAAMLLAQLALNKDR